MSLLQHLVDSPDVLWLSSRGTSYLLVFWSRQDAVKVGRWMEAQDIMIFGQEGMIDYSDEEEDSGDS